MLDRYLARACELTCPSRRFQWHCCARHAAAAPPFWGSIRGPIFAVWLLLILPFADDDATTQARLRLSSAAALARAPRATQRT